MNPSQDSWTQPVFRGVVMFTCFVALPLMLLSLLGEYQDYQAFLHKGQRIEVHVLDSSEQCAASSCVHYLTYEYVVDSATYVQQRELVVSDSLYNRYQKTGIASAYYLPENPAESTLLDNFSYERSLDTKIFSISILWALLLGVAWFPSDKKLSPREKILRSLRYSAIYTLIIVLAFGGWVTEMEMHPIPLYIPLLLVFGVIAFNFYYEGKYTALDYPLFVAMFVVGCILFSLYSNDNGLFAYTLIATMGALLMDETREMVSTAALQH